MKRMRNTFIRSNQRSCVLIKNTFLKHAKRRESPQQSRSFKICWNRTYLAHQKTLSMYSKSYRSSNDFRIHNISHIYEFYGKVSCIELQFHSELRVFEKFTSHHSTKALIIFTTIPIWTERSFMVYIKHFA